LKQDCFGSLISSSKLGYYCARTRLLILFVKWVLGGVLYNLITTGFCDSWRLVGCFLLILLGEENMGLRLNLLVWDI